MKRPLLFFVFVTLILSACSATPAVPTSTPFPTVTPMPTFEAAKYGKSDIDVTYCTVDGKPQKMDIYYPKSGGPWPVLLSIHGGAWKEGDKAADGAGWSTMTAEGFLVVSINYRMYPEYKFPAMIEDAKCAVRYLRAHAGEYNLDPEHIIATGASAGGHLVALLGTADESAGWDVGEYLDQSSRVQAVIDMAGPSDFTLEFPDGLATVMYAIFGGLPGTQSPKMIAASPVTYVTPDDPPFLILHGDRDGTVPLEQGQAMYDKLVATGVPATLIIVKNGNHSLQGIDGPTEPTQEEINQTIHDFLIAHMK
jgi:acetyl esterase/lipase